MNTQHASAVLMVRPAAFGFDTQSATSNSFQHLPTDETAARIAAITEFDNAVATLKKHGLQVVVVDDTPNPEKPDAIFPNNWFSTWPDGRVFLYPMQAPVRRPERRADILDLLKQTYTITKISDFSRLEKVDMFLEGTGAIVFDHLQKVAYGCLSSRCNPGLFRKHVSDLGYTPFLFTALDAQNIPIYHTNVVLAIQTQTAVVCSAALPNSAQRTRLLQTLAATNREVIDISFTQLQQFAGNILEVSDRNNEPCIILSQQAFDAFTVEQRATLEAHAKLIPISIPTIETIGGGSARCMLAEIFLPSKAAA